MRLTSERDALLRADGGDQGVDLAGGDAVDPGLHDQRAERLIDPAPGLEDRGEEAARTKFWDRERNVAHLGGERARAAAVAVTEALIGALMALSTE